MSQDTQAPGAPSLLPQAAWYPPNHRQLSRWLARDRGSLACAVFDWDNTCIFNDIGDAAYVHQLDRLCLALAPDAFIALGDGLTGIQGSAAHQALWRDCIAAYRALWPFIAAGRGEQAQGSLAHRDFRAKMGVLYTAVAHAPRVTPGDAAGAYATLAELWRNVPAHTVRAHVHDVLAHHARLPMGYATWRSATAGDSGQATFQFATGLAAYDEMRDLMHALRLAGVTPYVISASTQPVVQAAAAWLRFPVQPEHIFGLRPAGTRGPHGPYPVTYRAGKVAVIRDYLPSEPVLVAGDALTDLEMLTGFAATQVRLLVHRPSQADHLAALYAQADGPVPAFGPITLLQGHDSQTGRFIPEPKSTIEPLEHAVAP